MKFEQIGTRDKLSNSYYRIPWLLMTDARFAGLSDRAMLIYAILLDRCFLSAKNKWIDGQGRAYILYDQKDMHTTLSGVRIGIHQIAKYYDELAAYGLIERAHFVFSRKQLIYVKDFRVTEDDSTAFAAPEDLYGAEGIEESGADMAAAKNSLPYIGSGQSKNFKYIELPKHFLSEAPFTILSVSALILYAVLLDQTEKSKRNNIVDENGDLYVELSGAETEEMFGWKKSKRVSLIRSLEESGLVRSVRVYTGANRYYVYRLKNDSADTQQDVVVRKQSLRWFENSHYSGLKTVITEVGKQSLWWFENRRFI